MPPNRAKAQSALPTEYQQRNSELAAAQAALSQALARYDAAKVRISAASAELAKREKALAALPKSVDFDERESAIVAVQVAQKQVTDAAKEIDESEAAARKAEVALNALRHQGAGAAQAIQGEANLAAAERKRQADLKSRYDLLNTKWQAFEAQLQAIHVPHEVVFQLPQEQSQPQEYPCFLGLVKCDNAWRICFRVGPHEEGGALSEWKPILEWGVSVRIMAAHFAEAIRNEVMQAAEGYSRMLDEAIQSLDSVLNSGGRG